MSSWGDISLTNKFTHHRAAIQSNDLAAAPSLTLLHEGAPRSFKTGFTEGKKSIDREFVYISFRNSQQGKCGLIRPYQTVFVIQQNSRFHRIRQETLLLLTN